MITIAQILKEMRRQLDWRGCTPEMKQLDWPGSIPEMKQGHIVLTREMAERLCEWAIILIKERDALVWERDHVLQPKD